MAELQLACLFVHGNSSAMDACWCFFFFSVIEHFFNRCITSPILIGGSASAILVAVKFVCCRGKTALVSHGKISFCSVSQCLGVFRFCGTIQSLGLILRKNSQIV
jgi:hypothetical protein